MKRIFLIFALSIIFYGCVVVKYNIKGVNPPSVRIEYNDTIFIVSYRTTSGKSVRGILSEFNESFPIKLEIIIASERKDIVFCEINQITVFTQDRDYNLVINEIIREPDIEQFTLDKTFSTEAVDIYSIKYETPYLSGIPFIEGCPIQVLVDYTFIDINNIKEKNKLKIYNVIKDMSYKVSGWIFNQ